MRSQANRRGSPRRYTWAMSTIDERACGKSECDNFGKPGRNIVGHGWSNSRRLQRRPRYADPVFVLSVPPHTLQRYRRRRPDFVANQVASLRVGCFRH